jgi:hypothetical protein
MIGHIVNNQHVKGNNVKDEFLDSPDRVSAEVTNFIVSKTTRPTTTVH